MAMLLGTWELGSGYGHIAHLAPLAQALGARGHRMVVAARNPATAKAAPGAPFAGVLTAPLYRLPPAPRTATITYGQVVTDGGLTDLSAAIELVTAWLGLFEQVRPEAIVAEHAPVSLLAAHVARLPVAMVGPPFMVPPAQRPLASLLPWATVSEAERAAADAPADAVVREVCRRFGAPKLDGLAALIATAQPFLTSWPELDTHGPRRGATYYGPLSGFAGKARPGWPGGQGPKLFVYLPFDRPRAAELIAAIGALGWPAIWHAVRPAGTELPANIAFSPEPVDMAHVLAEATLLVGRAAHGTSSRALQAGRPQLLLPDTLESMLTARCLATRRLGAVGDAGLRASLEKLAADEAVAAALVATRTRYERYQPDLAAAQLAGAIIGEFAL